MLDRIQMQISNKFLPNTHSREIIPSLCNNLRGFGAEIKVTKFSLSLISLSAVHIVVISRQNIHSLVIEVNRDNEEL